MANIFTNLSGNIDAQQAVDSYMTSPQYKLTYYCESLGEGKSFLVIGCIGGSSYFFPLQFLGSQEVILSAELNGVVTCKLNGNAKVSGLTFATYTQVTEADNEVLQLVRDESSYWSRIKDITNDVGKVRTDMLQGLINMTVNAFSNKEGTITQKDGIMTWMNGATPESSTQAVQICGGAIMVSNAKDAQGNWIYKTAINGAGISTDAIAAGKITGLEVDSGKITGTDITGGSITGVGITGATIISGTQESGNYTTIDALGNIKGYKNGNLVLSIEVQNDTNPNITLKRSNGTGYISIGPNWWEGRDCFGINCYGGDLFIDTNAKIHIMGSEVEFSCDRVKFYGDIVDKYNDVVTGSSN